MKDNKWMIRVRQWVGDFLTYNRTEQRGIFVLSLLLLALVAGQAFIPRETVQPLPDLRGFSAEAEAFEREWKRAADSDSLAREERFLHAIPGSYKPSDRNQKQSLPPKPILVIDLNTADTFDLQQLKGIGPAFARRIIRYRDRLGGYCEPGQVMEVFGMDTARYRLIRENLTAERDSIHPMDLNSVTFKEMLRHPYFPFPVTKKIMLYRQKNKSFRSIEELKGIEGITDSSFRRMVVYLRLGP